MCVQRAGRKALFKERSVGGNGALVLVLVAMGRNKVCAICRAIDGDFAFSTAAHGTDFFSFCRAEAARFSFSTNRTRQNNSPAQFGGKNTVRVTKCKIEKATRP